MTYQNRLMEARAYLLDMYLNPEDTRDWAVAWSGGKDSTVVMALVVSMLDRLPAEKRTRKIYGVMSDTKVENPELGAYMNDQVTSLNAYAKRKDLPLEVVKVERPVEHSYFVLTLGRGYFMPQNNGAGRWCTDRLKLQPQNKALEAINPSHILIGTRIGESAKRAESIAKWSISERIGEHANLPETNTFMAIVDWTIDDVWRYLSEEKLGWTSTAEVRRLYKEATGECGINNPKGVERKAKEMESCGARFGCWLCPVVTNDRSTEEMTKSHPWMEPLTEWRQTQAKVYGHYKPMRPKGQKRNDRSAELRYWEAINEQVELRTKAGKNRAGKRMKDGQGTLTVEARKWLFGQLMDTQRMVNRLRSISGLPALKLIDEEEIGRIHALWDEDYADYPHLVTNTAGLGLDGLEALIEGDVSQVVVDDYIERRQAKKDAKEASE